MPDGGGEWREENDVPKGGELYDFTQENVDKAPASHGVYALFDGDALIYYGRAVGTNVTLRSRLQSHERGSEGTCSQGATHYRRETTNDPAGREEALLNDYRRLNDRLPRCNERVA
jgi:hypothetical protein